MVFACCPYRSNFVHTTAYQVPDVQQVQTGTIYPCIMVLRTVPVVELHSGFLLVNQNQIGFCILSVESPPPLRLQMMLLYLVSVPYYSCCCVVRSLYKCNFIAFCQVAPWLYNSIILVFLFASVILFLLFCSRCLSLAVWCIRRAACCLLLAAHPRKIIPAFC